MCVRERETIQVLTGREGEDERKKLDKTYSVHKTSLLFYPDYRHLSSHNSLHSTSVMKNERLKNWVKL